MTFHATSHQETTCMKYQTFFLSKNRKKIKSEKYFKMSSTEILPSILNVNQEILKLILSTNLGIKLHNRCHCKLSRSHNFLIKFIWAGTRKRGLSDGLQLAGSSNAHAQSPTGAIEMRFCLKFCLGPYYMSGNSKGSGETALMRRLAWAYAGRL